MSYGPPPGAAPPPPSQYPPPGGYPPPPPPYGGMMPPPPKTSNTGVIIGVVAGIVAVLLVGVGSIWLFSGGTPGGGEDGYPQSYEPTAAVYTDGGDFTYVPGYDLCGSFSHAGIDSLIPVTDVASSDELNPETGSGFYGCWIDYSNKETHGDGYVQGHLDMRAGIYLDSQRAIDEFEWDQELMKNSGPQPFDGLAIDSVIVYYEDPRGDSIYITARSGNLWLSASLTTNRPQSSLGKPGIPMEVMAGILADVFNEALPSMATA
ncbi:hypothetical protein FB566_1593 [Stackebrandtia endophytica]|uniref:Uncharacterized protein n=1 Tax=Stackebrandtia endophytica TaxID=1496996 RepID=A0A543ATY9_9ACTN|nr:hypothetical protein [Stackebrandtia endophytica]TQL76073.1 hypothetical protein FB566_1593 [Stackebrandtia endophytica]